MKKKTLSLALALLMVLALFPASALAADVTVTQAIPFQYDSARPFSEGLAAVKNENGDWGFIDKTGKEVIPCQYFSVGPFSEGLAAVRLLVDKERYTFKSGFIDKTGEVVIPIQYSNALSFSDGLAPVSNEFGGEGYINKAGELVIPYLYYRAYPFSEGVAAVSIKMAGWAYIDTTGKEVLFVENSDFYHDYAGSFSDDLAIFGDDYNRIYGYIDKTGKEVLPCQYYGADNFSDGLAAVGLGSGEQDEDGYFATYRYGFIDKTGKVIIPDRYDQAYSFSNGLAVVALGSEKDEDGYSDIYRYGYIDKTGTEVVPLQYDNAGSFSEGLAPVKQGGKWGYISISGVSQSTTPSAQTETAVPTNDKLTVDGTLANPTVYKINGSNYFKIRDVAALLNGTEKQFAVGYDGEKNSVTATTGQGYDKLDTDLAGAPAGGDEAAQPSNDTVYVNGEKIDAQVYKIDGGNYFKLRDLGRALNFSVDWNAEQGMIIDTSRPYSE